MSFTGEVKDEVSKLDFMDAENISELSAIVNFSLDFDRKIRIITENNSVARRVYSLFKEIYQIYPNVSVKKGYNYSKKVLYAIEVKKNTDYILKSLGINGKVPEEFIWSDEDLIRAYLRGLFLVSASVNDPKKSRYHLEFMVNDKEYAKFVSELLNQFNLNSKVLKRENKYMIYIKEAEKIGDFLRLMEAINAVFYYEDIRIYRDHKNMTNRLNNCEQANVDKIIETAIQQIKDIEKIESIGALDLLDEKTKEAAIYRKKYPESSLLELSKIITLETGNSITKSGLYHRFNKIKQMANKIK